MTLSIARVMRVVDARDVMTDAGVAALTSLVALQHLDPFLNFSFLVKRNCF